MIRPKRAFFQPQVPSLKYPLTIFTEIPSKHYFLTILVSIILTGCVSQPRYRSEPIETAKGRSISDEQAYNTEGRKPYGEKAKSRIDKAKMERIIDSFLGAPYKPGGENKAGMDCSGLVVSTYKQYAGFKLPHDTKKLYKLVKRVDKDDLGYGDLVFFSDGWFSGLHVGIYMGEGKFVHSKEGSGVVVSSLNEDYYNKRYIGARRVIP